MDKLKIAMIVNSNIFSGLEKVVSEIMIALEDRYEFIYVTKYGPVVERFTEMGLKVYIINDINKKNLLDFVNEWNPDIIHTHDYKASTIACMMGFKRVISHLHSNPLWIKSMNIKSFAYLYFALKSAKVLTVSNSIKNEFIFKKFICENKYINIGNPVSYSDVMNRVQCIDEEKEYDICVVGRVTSPKNPLKFLRIIEEIKNTNSNIKACWVGDGELKDECEDYILEHHLEKNVFFLGYLINPFEIMVRSRVFCLTSNFEGYGLVAFEALSLGLPCVVSNVGGLVEIVDNTCGFLCDTEKAFVENINMLLNDDLSYQQFSSMAVQRAKKLDNKNEYMNNISNIYLDLMG